MSDARMKITDRSPRPVPLTCRLCGQGFVGVQQAQCPRCHRDYWAVRIAERGLREGWRLALEVAGVDADPAALDDAVAALKKRAR